MGKVFGISDLPVSTIMSPFAGTKVPKPTVTFIKSQTQNARYVQQAKTMATMQNVSQRIKNGFRKIIGR